jgi:hypothetical protein
MADSLPGSGGRREIKANHAWTGASMLVSVTEGTMTKPRDLVQGTLDLLIVRVVALEPMHAWAIAPRIRQMTECPTPGAAQAGAARLHHGGVEDLGKQPPRQVLLAYACRPQGTDRRSRKLGAPIDGNFRSGPRRLKGGQRCHVG